MARRVKARFRHYPLRILIGNGGFDEGASDTAPRYHFATESLIHGLPLMSPLDFVEHAL